MATSRTPSALGNAPRTDALSRAFAGFGTDFKARVHERYLYAYDAAGIFGLPDAVLHLRSADDARRAVEAAREAGVALVARGSGTGLSGGCVATTGSVALSFEHLRRIGVPDLQRYRVWAEAGVVNRSLDAVLEPDGLLYAPDPSSHRISTIGGNVAENSGGPRALKYGVTGHHIMQLEVVDASGMEGRLAADETQSGPDLVSLVVGSEGTLALVTAAELALERRPADIRTVLVSFVTMGEATAFVSAVIARGIIPTALEFIDRLSIARIEEWGVATYSDRAGAVILLDIDGDAAEVASASHEVEALARSSGALEERVAETEAEREALWLGRRGVYGAVAKHSKRMLIQDVTVPRERLTEMIGAVERIAARYGLETATVGHAGDGNLHPNFGYDPDDADETHRIHEANREILETCVAFGGSITGEHGIGSDKLPYMSVMYGPTELGLMAAVKGALDPDRRFNPGKAVPEAERIVPAGSGRRVERPVDDEEVRDAILASASARHPLRLRLDGFHDLLLDEANMTLEVGAGVEIEEIGALLAPTGLEFPLVPMRERTVARTVLLHDYGPNHTGHGLPKRSLLASTLVTGRGEIAHMGRAVVKNVAGYDLVRPLIGSAGRLAVPTRFTFLLRPRESAIWGCRTVQSGWVFSRAEHPQLTAIYALPDGDGMQIWASFHDRLPVGWTETDDAGRELLAVQQRLRDQQDMLDIAVPPDLLPFVLDLLPEAPIAVLPAAARLFLPANRDTAVRMTYAIEERARGATRVLWGLTRERLNHPDPLASAWEERLLDCFDPHRLLGEWLTSEERP